MTPENLCDSLVLTRKWIQWNEKREATSSVQRFCSTLIIMICLSSRMTWVQRSIFYILLNHKLWYADKWKLIQMWIELFLELKILRWTFRCKKVLGFWATSCLLVILLGTQLFGQYVNKRIIQQNRLTQSKQSMCISMCIKNCLQKTSLLKIDFL